MVITNTRKTPGTTICPNRDGLHFACHYPASSKPGMGAKPNFSSIGNLFSLTGQYYGSANDDEQDLYLFEIPEYVTYGTTEPRDTAFTENAFGNTGVVLCKYGNVYWIRGSSLTVAEGDTLVCAASGLFAKTNSAYNTTPLSMHTFKATRAFTSATWVEAEYRGRQMIFTATA